MWLQEYNYEYCILSRKQTVQRNEKELLGGLGRGRGTGGSACGRFMILEKGFRLISLTWLIIPAELTLALQKRLRARSRVSLPPESSSRLPPLPAASPLGYLRAAGNLRGHAPCRLNLKAPSSGRASSERPFPTPSAWCRFQLSTQQVTRVLSV